MLGNVGALRKSNFRIRNDNKDISLTCYTEWSAWILKFILVCDLYELVLDRWRNSCTSFCVASQTSWQRKQKWQKKLNSGNIISDSLAKPTCSSILRRILRFNPLLLLCIYPQSKILRSILWTCKLSDIDGILGPTWSGSLCWAGIRLGLCECSC